MSQKKLIVKEIEQIMISWVKDKDHEIYDTGLIDVDLSCTWSYFIWGV